MEMPEEAVTEMEEKMRQIEDYSERVYAMTSRVKDAKQDMQAEMENLEAVRKQMTSDPLMRLAMFKDQSVFRQVSALYVVCSAWCEV